MAALQHSSSLNDSNFDSLVVVATDLNQIASNNIKQILTDLLERDSNSHSRVSFTLAGDVPGKRLVYSPIGPINRDYDDARALYEAAETGIKRAISAGSRKPLLYCPVIPSFPQWDKVALLGALQALYVPLEIRENLPDRQKKADLLGWYAEQANQRLFTIVEAYEAGRTLSRDIGGSDPERMAPVRFQEFVESAFNGTSIKVEVITGDETLQSLFPLLAAVDRATKNVPRHRGRVIFLKYEGEGPIDETLLITGKGICYDTGGADIKAGGHMAGMHRDKCAAASVAGLFKTLDILKPKGLKVLGAMCVVRNSVGSEAYVADEIITSRAKARVRVGNTDAEGRMVMADVLCLMKEKALSEVNPSLFTWATLTGHVIIAHGETYSAVLGNGPAVQAGTPEKLIKNSFDIADPCQLSTITREDYDFARGKSEYEDLLQCNNKPSSQTPRGHQFPAAFMIMASGLDKHGKDSEKPLKYVHIDVAGSSGPFPGIPTASPLLAFLQTYVAPRL